MHQERFWRDSRSLPKRSHISWISTQHWSSWRSLQPDGQGHAERFHLSNDASRIFSIQQNWWISLKNMENRWAADRTGRPVVPFLHTTSDVSTCKIFWFVAVRSFTADSIVCCNRRGLRTPHLTRHIFSLIYTHMRGSSRVLVERTSWAMRSCVCVDSLRLLHFPLLTIFSLIILSFLLSINFIFHDVVGTFPVHCSLLRTLAPLPSTTLSHNLTHYWCRIP